MLFRSTYIRQKHVYHHIEVRSQLFMRQFTKKICEIPQEQYEDPELKLLQEKACNAVSYNNAGVEGLLRAVSAFGTGVLGLFVYMVIAGSIHPVILLLLFGLSVIGAFCNSLPDWYENKIRDENARDEMTMQYIDRLSDDAISGKDIRVFGLKKWIIGKYGIAIKNTRRRNAKKNSIAFAGKSLETILTAGRDLICYLYLISQLKNGMSLTMFVFYLGIIGGFSTWFAQVSDSFAKMKYCSVHITNFRNFLNLGEDAGEKKIPQNQFKTVKVVFDHVTFCYKGAEKPVLNDISFSLKSGEHKALVGLNGAGKSTLVKLISGLYLPTKVWKAQALQNCREMVCQCRSHPSIFLWGVRVSGSADDESFYKRTNETVRRLDPTRPTAGTRSTRRSQLLEDVYAYADYSYHGRGVGCEARTAVTPDTRKGYLISEFEGAQFPAKPFDDEPHRLAQALRYAAVLNDTIAQQGVAGSFGWCMTDYNTHREFGSGDRISYQGVMDMFRNPKLSAAVYASQKTPRSPSDIVLEISSSMALGDHPGGFAGACWAFTNAESLRLYRDNDFVAEFTPDRRGRFAALPHPPIEIHDFVGLLLEKYEGIDRTAAPQVAAILNEMRRDSMELSPLSRARMYSLRLSWNELVQLYYKYIGVLGSPAAVYRFEAVWHGRAVRTVVKEPVQSVRLECTVHNPILTDGPTWDCAAVSLRAIDQNGNLLPYCGEAVQLSVEGPLRILGPSVVPLRGGMAGTYLATTGEAGPAKLHCRMEGALDTEVSLTIRCREE